MNSHTELANPPLVPSHRAHLLLQACTVWSDAAVGKNLKIVWGGSLIATVNPAFLRLGELGLRISVSGCEVGPSIVEDHTGGIRVWGTMWCGG